MVIVDTSVLSLAFRRRTPRILSSDETQKVQELKRLAITQQAGLIGIVRQETLTGIRIHQQFVQLKNLLDGFAHISTETADHDSAAECSNICRAKGIAASGADMLVCAMAIRNKAKILTADLDFNFYARHLPVSLHA